MSIFGSKDDNGARPRPKKLGQTEKDDTETVVGPSVKVEGDFNSHGDMRIEGEVSGSVRTSKNLAIGPGARVEANVQVENAEISGEVTGNVTANEKLELTESARVSGDIKAKTLVIAPGALFSGSCEMQKEATEEKASKKEKDKKKEVIMEEKELVSLDSKK
jgi:cytoskeletal protein CcmA (bactofilin family)